MLVQLTEKLSQTVQKYNFTNVMVVCTTVGIVQAGGVLEPMATMPNTLMISYTVHSPA